MRVAIIHPWFPQYRKPFFDELVKLGKAKNIDIEIFHGSPPPEWKERGDSVSHPDATALRTHFFSFGRKNFVFKSLNELWRRPAYDVLVLEQAVRNLETYLLMLHRRNAALAFWGHGRTYTQPVGKLQERIKSIMTNRADWFFSYTKGGADAVVGSGFNPDHVTIVQNSIDSQQLRSSVGEVTDSELEHFAKRNDLRGKTGLFIGGLDQSKRLDFLIESGQQAFEKDQEFRLLIAGAGQLEDWVRECSRKYPWLIYLGPLFGADKAAAMAASEVLLMPGRVGLVAVDSFASSTPIITTNWKWHAPEFEYLRHGINALIVPDDVSSYANCIVSTLNDRSLLHSLREGAGDSAEDYSVSRMAKNFIRGLVAMSGNS